MGRTLILLFHPELGRSRANAALARRAWTLPGVEVIDMQARFPDGHVDLATDAEAEAGMLLKADRIVLQFPIRWYSTPPLLKAWQDAVLTRMFYLEAATEGDRLGGTPLMIAATAGNVPDAYRRGGQNHFSMDEILIPLKATAHRCGLPWHPPYIVYRADRLDEDDLAGACDGYATALEGFAGHGPADAGQRAA